MTFRRDISPTDGELQAMGEEMAKEMAVSFRVDDDGTIYAVNPDGTEIRIPKAVAVPGAPGKSAYELYAEAEADAGRVPLDQAVWTAEHFGQDGHSPYPVWSGTELAFTLPDGSSSKAVDLKGAPGNNGIVPMYGTDGKLWRGVISREYQVRIDSNGRWQVDYSELKFTDTPRVHAIAWYETTSASDQAINAGATKDKAHASGRVVRGVSGSLIGLTSTWRFAPAGTIVSVSVTGPTE